MQIEANYVDIQNKTIYPAHIEIKNNKIASITKIDKECNNYILPGFVDAHIHIESSMLIPSEFARVAVLHGSVATVSDPHEIANVNGIEGVEFMIANANKTPFHFFFGASSCVPATPFESSGATLDVEAIQTLLKHKEINHLGEVMAFPNVINGDEELLAKIKAAKDAGVVVDGHAPMLRGEDLQKYIDAGITTDHEASSYEEAKEKIERGMKILIREGSAAKNYEALHPLIAKFPNDLMFCSDDKHPNDLVHGHINELVKRSIANGYDLFDTLRIASLNPIEYYNLDVGKVQVGDSADFILVKDLENFEVLQTVIAGEVVAQDGKTLLPNIEQKAINNFHATKTTPKDLEFFVENDTLRVIEAFDGELFTKEKIYQTNITGNFSSDIQEDILKITVLNRHANTPIAIGFIYGFGLKEGAIASSIAHDSHNIIAVGVDDESISKAINTIINSQGGVCALNKTTTKHLPLSVGGIMSNEDGFEVAKKYDAIDNFAKQTLGSTLKAPFMTLSFMALLVIPELKLSDKGLFDGRVFDFCSVKA